MMELLLTCMDQKELLLTNILNLTKRMEVRCRQEDVDLEDFISQRQVFMDRVDKCTALVQKKLNEEGTDPDTRKRLLQLTQGNDTVAPVSDEEKALFDTALRCKRLVRNAKSLDSAVTKMLRIKRDETREKLNEIRKKQMTQESMFHKVQP